MRFSLLIPTRERVELLHNLILSVVLTTNDITKVEILIAYDDDDVKTEKFLTSTPWIIKTRWFKFERKDSISEYFNELEKQAQGEFLFCLNDDAEFVTKNWDVIAYKQLQDFLKIQKSGAVIGIISDGTPISQDFLLENHANYCSFPIVSKKSAQYLGWLFNPEYVSWGADINLFKIHNAVRRACQIKGVNVIHHSPHTDTRKQDTVNKRVECLYKWHPVKDGRAKMLLDVDRFIRKIQDNSREIPNIPEFLKYPF